VITLPVHWHWYARRRRRRKTQVLCRFPPSFKGLDVCTGRVQWRPIAHVKEHVMYIVAAAYSPCRNSLIEGVEVVFAVHAVHIPIRRAATAKHFFHFNHAGRVPAADGLVEGVSTQKHLLHIGHLGRVPAPDVFVEGVGFHKHLLHSDNLGRVPAPDVLVEGVSTRKHLQHGGHAGRVPAPDGLVESGTICQGRRICL
jgi:hypothetical protein